ncbi:MAG: SRPBCC domain-containing protein [Saprospiraceae bacterium]|nr:SRPBCC domain-containing protein [Saprospiraceae bacterium]MBK8549427.1 SRPBCC domain-containing protein [Saprospiraceae bacterium]MBK8855175.1 SRPBCC domain-containing protein [Saprospiraceae bacterium]
MNSIDWTSFTRVIAVKGSLTDIYNAWSKSSEMERWFLSKADFYDEAQNRLDQNVSASSGCSYAWQWYLYDETEKGKVLEANGRDFFSFTFAGDCIVDVKLTELGKRVVVELTQKNIPSDDFSKINIRLGCDSGWSFFLVNLKSVYEGGLDLREKNERQKGMVNC